MCKTCDRALKREMMLFQAKQIPHQETGLGELFWNNFGNTVEPLNKGHLRTEGFVPYSEVLQKQSCIQCIMN